ncbi:MAG: YicC family protein [Oscillospiraceae bacterium]|nr:YicC family protein [Oscillospiraceae bacterium]
MTRSMTGYGRSQQQLGGWDITVEIKSVNHRYFEFSSRTPRSCNYMEDKLKSLVQSRISRGKCDLYLQLAATEGNNNEVVKVNIDLAKSYLDSLKSLSEATGLPFDVSLSSLSRYPDVLTSERAAIDEDELWSCVSQVANEALDNFVAMRETEGARLREDILSRLETVLKLTEKVEQQSPQTVENYRNKLYQKLQTLLADRNVDDARVLTEAAIFADRVAVDEETVRLRSHVQQFREILSSSEPVGRKLDFLTQELNRESNTIGSKAQDAKVAAIVIELKSELEKIREQIQNIE